MPVFDAGLFLSLVGLAIGSLLASYKLGAMFKILGAMAFFASAIIMFGNYDIAFSTITTDGLTVINETKYLIGSGDPENTPTSWLGWIFMAMGIITAVIFLYEMITGEKFQ